MSWDDIFGTNTKKFPPTLIKVPQDKLDRDRCVTTMARRAVEALKKDWATLPGDERIDWTVAMNAALSSLEHGEWEVR
ncbi:MAG: hypothetical protein ABFE07_29035 [Armatimonadia bacterium]